MNRIQRFALADVLPFIGKAHHKFWIPRMRRKINVRLGNQRMRLIGRTQQCAACLVQGAYLWLEASGCWSPHFNLYAKNYYGDETMLTMDHVLPRSKGGTTTAENIQLLCRLCNKVKKNDLIALEDILRLRFKRDPKLFPFVLEAYRLQNPEAVPLLEEVFANRKKPVQSTEEFLEELATETPG